MASSHTNPDDSEFSVPTATLDLIVSYILRSIPSDSNNLQRDSLCAACFSSAVEHLVYAGEPATSVGEFSFTYPQLRKRHPNFFNAVVSLALNVNEEEQVRILEQRFPHCQCDVVANNLLRSLHIPGPPFLQQLADGVFTFLRALASIPTETLFRSMDGNGKARSKRPNALKEASHYILQEAHTPDTIHASFCWYKVTKEHAILHFVIRCFERHPTSFRAPACSPEGQAFLYAVTSELRDAVSAMQRDPSTITKASVKALVAPIGFLKAFMLDLLPPNLKFQHSCTPLVKNIADIFFVQMFDHLDSSKKELLVNNSIPQLLACNVIQSVHFVISELPHAEKIICHFDGASHLMGARQPHLEGWMVLNSLRDRKKCANPACGISPNGQRFQKCSRCGVPSYCSRKCQMEAWSLPICSHRSVCKDWTILMKHCPPMSVLTQLLADQNRQDEDRLKPLIAAVGISDSRMIEIQKHYETFFRITRENPAELEKPSEISTTSDTRALTSAGAAAIQTRTSDPLSSASLPRLRGLFNKSASEQSAPSSKGF